MNYSACRKLRFGDFAVLLCILISFVFLAPKASAQLDQFGELDRLSIDSVIASPGQTVNVNFYMKNDEPISSVSIPVIYDTSLLKIAGVDFAGSRLEYISNKLVTPPGIDTIQGHFLITSFILFEDPIPVGEGVLFTASFLVKENAPKGSFSLIDTLFYPPGGNMIFVEASSSAIIKPIVSPGLVSVSEQNMAPVLQVISDETIFEGDSLRIQVSGRDLNQDSLVITCLNKPSGATFVDNQDGTATFSWVPSYTGPNSADGSPYTVSFRVSDGSLFSESSTEITVVNKNRQPVVDVPAVLSAESGDIVSFTINGYDPDFDELTWDVTGLPAEATFDGEQFEWSTRLTDTGSTVLTFIASDPQGHADTAQTTVSLTATSIYELWFDTTDGFPGDQVTCHLSLDNKFPVGSFNILFSYDPTVLSMVSLTNSGLRTENFEYFSYITNEDNISGHVRLFGIADNTEPVTTMLGTGNGPIATLTFRIANDLSYSGYSAPLRFIFLDEVNQDDNTLTDTLGAKITQDGIVYQDGAVQVLSFGEVLVGDINLNGIAFDIGDAIYFTNYFINPFIYPMSPLQYANSDINGDNVAATIADLVAIIKIITEGGKSAAKMEFAGESIVSYEFVENNGSTLISTASDDQIGAVMLTFDKPEQYDLERLLNATDYMTVSADVTDDEIRVLVYSLEGFSIPVGTHDLLELPADDWQLLSIEMASADGQMMTVEQAQKDAIVPESFTLYQNYPNPFNPETKIAFDLPVSAHVKLTIYNILGEQVSTLIDASLQAGTHTVNWDSRTDNGETVASGVYFYRLETDDRQLSRKMLLLK